MITTVLDRVPFTDLSLQWRQIADDVRADVENLFKSSAFCLGPYVEQFEDSVARYLEVPHAIGVNSGTSALHLALIVNGIGPGDKVLVPAHTFIATIWAVLYVGATPVLCDVRLDSATIDCADAERRIDQKVRAIIPVHLYGQPSEMDAVTELAKRHNLIVIEDAAQAIGARYRGRRVGGIGATGCFSFYPGKNLGAAGEAGLVVTRDPAHAKRMRSLRHHAQTERYVHGEIGFNYRMEGIQGLVLNHKLRRLDQWTAERRVIAHQYQQGLSGLPLHLPQIVNDDHVWHLFVVLSDRRDALKAHLAAQGIETGLHYPVPLHRQPCLAHLTGRSEEFPVSDRFGRECLSLPLFTGMTGAQVGRVVDAVRRFHSKA